ncbi:MAG: heparinase II/III family protein [Candidatus Latescibacteria bacterium]|nr:heparinase II/III family protein [Candidatus Latescibacterota bacterium]
MTLFRWLILLSIFFTSFHTLPVSADIGSLDIENALRKDLSHPYLYFTEEEKPAILERIKNDPECHNIMARFLAEANKLLYTPVELKVPGKEPNPDFTDNNDWLNYQRSNKNSAHLLAFVYQMTGDKKYAYKAFEFADALCDLPTWVDRRHEFPIIYDRVWPWNVSDDQAAFGYDIETADTAISLAAIYDWLYPALEKRQRDRIRGALLEKAITRVRGNYEYHWWATSYRCNWCAIGHSGIGTASLALLLEDPQLTDVIAGSYNNIKKQLDEIGVDGGWQEGCGYYRKSIHGMNFFADPLKSLTGGKYNLYKHRRLLENPITFLLYNTVAPGRLLVFEDSGANRAGTTHIWNKLAEETQSGETAWFRNFMWGDGNQIFDIIWPRSTVEPTLPDKPSKHFRTIDWVIMRSDFTDPDKAVVACKAGFNDDPHHGHLDCGQFTVYWRNQEYICDTTPAEYDQLYFLEDRWDYPQASSIGHNVVFVNGEQQIPAKHKNKPWQEYIGGKVLEFRPSDSRDYVIMDPSGAYPGKELKGWRRHIIYEKPVITVVVDEIESSPGAKIEVRFHSQCRTEFRDTYVLISGDSGKMACIPCVDGDFIIIPGHHPYLPLKKDARYSRIPYFDTVLTAQSAKTVIATVIVPVGNENDADISAKSVKRSTDANGNVILSFTHNGSDYSYRYINNDNGLVLE